MRRSIRGALGAALLAVVAVPVVAGATELTDQPPTDAVAPVVEVAPSAPSTEPAPAEVAPPAEAPAAAPAPAPEAIRAQDECDPNYFGACVPVGGGITCSDLTGGVISIGTDPYGLDGDGDGIACESDEGTPVTPETTVPPTTAPPETTTPPTTTPTTTTSPTPTTTPTSTTAPAQVAGAQESCHPSYEGACVPAGTGDVDCTEISAVNLAVVGPDEYGLDGDGDGIACEATPLAQVAQVRAATLTRTSTAELASTGSSSGIGVAGTSLLLAGVALLGGGMLLSTVGPWRTRGGFTVVRYDRYGRERRDRVVNDDF